MTLPDTGCYFTRLASSRRYPTSAVRAMAQPWDLGRFARTAVFFNSPDAVLQRLSPFPQGSRKLIDGTLWSAAKPMLEFGQLDDVVMGGVSESQFKINGDSAVFGGCISTENNGGFAGCRSRALTPALDLTEWEGIRLRVRGDGQRYKCIVRDSYDWNGIAWARA